MGEHAPWDGTSSTQNHFVKFTTTYTQCLFSERKPAYQLHSQIVIVTTICTLNCSECIYQCKNVCQNGVKLQCFWGSEVLNFLGGTCPHTPYFGYWFKILLSSQNTLKKHVHQRKQLFNMDLDKTFFFFLINATRLHVQVIYTNYKKTFFLQVISLCTLTTTYIYITKQNYTYFLKKETKNKI